MALCHCVVGIAYKLQLSQQYHRYLLCFLQGSVVHQSTTELFVNFLINGNSSSFTIRSCWGVIIRELERMLCYVVRSWDMVTGMREVTNCAKV